MSLMKDKTSSIDTYGYKELDENQNEKACLNINV